MTTIRDMELLFKSDSSAASQAEKTARSDVQPIDTYAQFLFPANILLDLDASDKADLFSKIAFRLEHEHQIDRALIIESLWAREQLGSTGIGQGVAIPHAQIKGLRHPMMAFVRLKSSIAFDAPDSMPVSEVFVLLIPVKATGMHLRMLADIAEMLCDPRFHEQLNIATGLNDVRRLFMRGMYGGNQAAAMQGENAMF